MFSYMLKMINLPAQNPTTRSSTHSTQGLWPNQGFCQNTALRVNPPVDSELGFRQTS